MIRIHKEDSYISLNYTSEDDMTWIAQKLVNEGSVKIRKCFNFTLSDIIFDDDDEINDEVIGLISKMDSVTFRLGNLVGDYYIITNGIINTPYEIKIYKECDVNRHYFLTYRDISIFSKITNTIKSDFAIGPRENEIPDKAFKQLIKQFPNTTELNKYSHYRIELIIQDYLFFSEGNIEKYNNYMNSKQSGNMRFSPMEKYAEYEVEKDNDVLQYLNHMLINENDYTEKDWQNQIIKIILLLYPKYSCVFDEVSIQDVDSDEVRRFDFLLVDHMGNVDIIEIKKPKHYGVVSKRLHGKNFIPIGYLSSAIMQVEKYIYALSRWSRKGEEIISKRYAHKIPKGLQLRFVNPQGIIIIGQEKTLCEKQLRDFEVIKRKYKNIVDILTYDELIRRLEGLISKFDMDNKL